MFSNLFNRFRNPASHTRRQPSKSNRRLRLESLESRTLMTMIPDLTPSGMLNLPGDPADSTDHISLRASGGQVHVTFNGTTRSFTDVSVTGVAIATDSGSSEITIESTLPATMTLNVNGNSAGSTDTLILNDGSSIWPRDYTITSDHVTRRATVPVEYHGIENLRLDAHSNDNTIKVESTAAGTITTINAGGGQDTIELSPQGQYLDYLSGQVLINGDPLGETSFDRVKFYDQFNPHNDTYSVVARATARFVSRDYMSSVTFNRVESLELWAGSGSNLINLDTDAANGGLQTVMVDAGPGNDIVRGSAGAERIFGGDGRDLLIGGLGADAIDGGAEDDLVIDGTTTYDTNAVACKPFSPSGPAAD